VVICVLALGSQHINIPMTTDFGNLINQQWLDIGSTITTTYNSTVQKF